MADATSSILTALLSSANIKNIGKEANASTADVQKVLTSALPSLLKGASAQANGASTAAGFLQALSSHAADSSGTIDLSDGAKILSHLLGSSTASTTSTVAKESGVDAATTKSILSAAAPLLMNVLGNQTNASSSNTSAVASLLSGVVSGNMGNLLTGLLGGSSSASSSGTDSSKKGTNLVGAAAGLLGSLLK